MASGGGGYDISLSDSKSSAASNSGSKVINNNTGANSTVLFVVVGVVALFGLVVWLKKGSRR